MNMSTKKGFTLVELLVAIGLFAIVVAIAAGGFVNALRTQREVAGLIAAQSNASLALEQMAREIRTGYLFCHAVGSQTASAACGCTTAVVGAPWTCNAIAFINANEENVVYLLAGTELQKATNGSTASVTGANVKITRLSFILQGQEEGDQWPPRITISMGVTANSTDPAIASDVFNIETSVSARAIDCDATLLTPC
jgi:prepilin-type N-terminal cleavage/methylation domain-containing protein